MGAKSEQKGAQAQANAQAQAQQNAEQSAQVGKLQAQQAAAVQRRSAPAAPAAPAVDPKTAELQNLADLHTQGILTDDEYAAAKAKALGI